MHNKYSIIIVVLMLLFFVMTGCNPKITDSQTESIENIVTNSLTVENASETDTNNDIANKPDNDDKQITDNFLERDIKVFENYFSKILSIDNVTISSDNIDLYGTSNGYRIYSVAYDGQLHATSLCSDTIGGYTFYKNIQYMPYAIAIYAIADDDVYTLKEAYEKGFVDIEEVYSFVPQNIKKQPY